MLHIIFIILLPINVMKNYHNLKKLDPFNLANMVTKQ